MAICVIDQDILLLEIPKTGTRWVRLVLRWLEVQRLQVKPIGRFRVRHGRKCAYPEHSRTVATVRHPVSWLESYWKYHSRYERDVVFIKGIYYAEKCLWPGEKLPGFSEWVEWIETTIPGAVTRFFNGYLVEGVEVMRQESLAEDLSRLLNLPLEKVQAVPRRNESPPDLKCEWKEGLRDLVLKNESEMIEKYYSGR